MRVDDDYAYSGDARGIFNPEARAEGVAEDFLVNGKLGGREMEGGREGASLAVLCGISCCAASCSLAVPLACQCLCRHLRADVSLQH
jgi:hypothetical protein